MAKNINKIKSGLPRRQAGAPSWNLSDLYSGIDDARIERDLAKYLKLAIGFEQKYKGKINSPALTAKKLFEALARLEEIAEQSAKPECYAHLVFAADANEKNGAFLQKIEERTAEISKRLLFFDLELAGLPETPIKKLLKAPALKKYAHHVKVVRLFKDHRLTEPEEKIINDKDLTGANAFTRLFAEITSSAKYELVRHKTRETLNESKILGLLYSPDRNLRCAAAASLTAGLRQNARLYTFIYNTLIQDKTAEDRLRKYAYPQEARHLSNEISKELVETIIDVCIKNYGIVSDYYNLKRKILGYKKLFDYDRCAPIRAADKAISFGESKNIILDSFGKFSPAIKEIAEKFFVNNWIDAQPRDQKRGGAFCMFATSDLHPYVFVNFLGRSRDVMTLAHELGHAAHAYLARPKGYFSLHAPLTLCETASVFGEMLVFNALKRETRTPKEKLALLCGKIEDIMSTAFRQIAMYQFESGAHRLRREKGELPGDALNEIWLKNNQRMFGNSLTLSDDYKYWWMYIPHFIRSPFYVYAYAFGELLTLSLFAQYQKEGQVFIEKYLRLLGAGGSEEPAKLLSDVGIDISRRQFWQAGIDVIKEMIEEAKKIKRTIER